MNYEWVFPQSADGSQIGISDSGIETFREDVYASLAREICQNSMDAKLQENNFVKLEFKLVYVDEKSLEDIDGLKYAFKEGKKHGEKLRDQKTIDFFEKGIDVLSTKTIPVLRISDFNTTGLTGSDKKYGSDWINLIKNSGISQKSGTSGGSYGIGKSASFACTNTRTIFYSTLDKYGMKASQGVSRLISFLNENNIFTSGTGYFGNGTDPIYDQINIDLNFSRKESGTDLYLLGFKDHEHWEDKIIKAILEGFLLSLYDGKLKVKVQDVIIDNNNLEMLINKYKEDKNMEKTYNYYKVLISKDTNHVVHTIEKLGDIEILVLIEQGLHKRALVSRINGMKIFDMGYISTDIPFAAIIRLNDKHVDSFFRLLEPPAHDRWVPALYDKNISLANRRVAEVRSVTKKIVEDLGQDSISAEMDIAGLGKYLPDMQDVFDSKSEEKKKKQEQSISDIKEVKGKQDRKDNKLKDNIEYGEFDDDGDHLGGYPDGDLNIKDGGRGKGGSYTDGGDNKVSKVEKIKLLNKRIIYIGDNLYRVLLNTKDAFKKGYLRFSIVGESSKEKAKIVDAISESNITLNPKKDRINFINNELETKLDILIELDYDEICSLEVDYNVYTE